MKIISLLVLFLISHISLAQTTGQVELLNGIIDTLVGEYKNKHIPVFNNIEQACNSEYVFCDENNQVIALDFEFCNLNGVIPASLFRLHRIEHINLSYNYLQGTIPPGVENLKKIKTINLAGNFLEAPLPVDLIKTGRRVTINLSKNSIASNNKKLHRLLSITNQINVKSCRHPDSIFVHDTVNDNKVLPQNNEKKKPAERMPLFPGCEEKNLEYLELKTCAETQLLRFVQSNLVYPYYERNNNIQGKAYVQFMVQSNGEIAHAKVVKNPGGRLGNTALWVVNRMNYTCQPWTPGQKDGKDVDVLFTMPIHFRLN